MLEGKLRTCAVARAQSAFAKSEAPRVASVWMKIREALAKCGKEVQDRKNDQPESSQPRLRETE